MPQLTAELFALCTGAQPASAEKCTPWANHALDNYGIQTANEVGMFLANVGHETGGLRFLSELWGPTDAQTRYDTRKDLGNLYLGDGFKYRGRGWFQTTGRGNYFALTQRLHKRWPMESVPDFVLQPDLLMNPEWAAISAADYTEMRNLRHYAYINDFDGYCDIINLGRKTEREGDSNGWKHRQQLWDAARPALILAGFPI